MIPVASSVKNLVRHEVFRSRVLVIDSEPLIRWALSVGLAGAGYETVAAANAGEARHLAASWPPPAVILLDLHQPDCSKLLDDLIQLAPGCRVLVLGTCCDGERKPSWQGLDVIAKPFDLSEIVRRVGEALRVPVEV